MRSKVLIVFVRKCVMLFLGVVISFNLLCEGCDHYDVHEFSTEFFQKKSEHLTVSLFQFRFIY